MDHYTTLEGVKGILESNSIYAFDAFRSRNDEEELDFGVNLVVKFLSRRSSLCKAERLTNFIHGANRDFLTRGVFILCFSKATENGLEYQWKNYGDYAIRFKKSFLEQKFEDGFGSFFIVNADQSIKYFDDCGRGRGGKNFDLEFLEELRFLRKNIDPRAWMNDDSLTLEIFKNFYRAAYLSKRSECDNCEFYREEERRILRLVWKNSDSRDKQDLTEIIDFKGRPAVKMFSELVCKNIEEIVVGGNGDYDMVKQIKEINEFEIRVRKILPSTGP
ncbi:MAG: hypothetical protein KGP29_00665 [Proteobacteria bacterium]|nr:hypothetical protein [Pseudomonadota bacterium]